MAEAESLENLRKARKAIRSRLTKKCTEITNFLSKVEYNAETIKQAQRLSNQLAAINNDLNRYNDRITPKIVSEDPDRLDEEIATQEQYQDRVIDARQTTEDCIQCCLKVEQEGSQNKEKTASTGNDANQSTSGVDGSTKTNFEKPTQHFNQPFQQVSGAGQTGYNQKLPRFAGDVRKFRGWWQLFEVAVHNNQTLATIEKFWRLKEAVVGEASGHIAHFDLVSEQYDSAVDALKRKYGREDVAERAHVETIRRLCDTTDLRRTEKLSTFVSTLEQNINALAALGVAIDSLSLTVAPMVVNCLPRNVRESFASWYDNKIDNDDYGKCELEALLEYLNRRTNWVRDYRLDNNKARHYNSDLRRCSNAGDASDQCTSNNRSNAFKQTCSNPPNDAGKKNYAFKTVTKESEVSCIFCNDQHESFKCNKPMSLDDRKAKLISENACFRCLKRNHNANKCRSSQKNCILCRGRHFAIMCSKNSLYSVAQQPSKKNSNTTLENTNNTTLTSTNTENTCLLQTGFLWAKVGNRRSICRTLLDTGSQHSYVSKELVEQLASTPVTAQAMVTHTIGGNVSQLQNFNVHKIELASRFTPSQSLQVQCLEINCITKGILPKVTDVHGLVPVADVITKKHDDIIQILIGADYLPHVYIGQERTFGDLVATLTIFGWFFYGKNGPPPENDVAAALCALHLIEPNLTRFSESDTTCSKIDDAKAVNKDVDFLWNLDSLGVEEPKNGLDSSLHNELKDFFCDTISQTEDGRYQVSLPFKKNISCLGDNEHIARNRLKRLLATSSKDKNLLKAIDDKVKDSLEKGFIELATPRKQGELAHYLPVQAVVKTSQSASSEPKVRICKDAGSRSKDRAALNDVLHQGPNLLPNLLKVLLRFRKDNIAIAADIEEAFHQLKVNENQRTFLRFLWPLDISNDSQAPIQEFWGTVLEFGLISSPWLFSESLTYHIDSQIKKRPADELILEDVKSHFYMDDIICGSDSVANAKQICKLLIEVFEAGHFPLGKWATNSKAVGQFIEAQAQCSVKVLVTETDAKILGVKWNQRSDTLGVFLDNAAASLREHKPTKRSLLKSLAKIFDPYGILACHIIKAKILLQKLWSNKRDWDTELVDDELDDYNNFVHAVNSHSSIEIDRALIKGKALRRELHIFCDASLAAYGCVVYLRTVWPDKQATVSFLMAKARVAPLRADWSIHRLELLGAVVAAKMFTQIKELLNVKLDAVSFWCDNSAVLGWLRDSAEKRKTFVANRIREIQSRTDSKNWNYVNSKDNPADILSRGSTLDTDELKNQWLFGPKWLLVFGAPQNPHELNPSKFSKVVDPEVERENKPHTTCAVTSTTQKQLPFLNAARFSTWPKAIRVTAYALRFIARCKREAVQQSACISQEEFENAKKVLLRNIQAEHFSTEVASKCSNVSKTSKIYQYAPFVDNEGLIRCRSRLEKSNEFSYDEKFPILLPGDDQLVKLLLSWIHVSKCLHSGGVTNILHCARTTFFIIHARKVAKSILTNCKVCVKYRALPGSEPVPPLPAFRLERTAPWAFTGADYAGPLYSRNDEGEKCKCYILLFVCAVTRAVHLELVPDLTKFEFLLAFRRFINRRPTVSRVISDNAPSFKGASKELQIIFDHIKDETVQSTLANNNIRWEFITPKAPQHGAWWERMVQTVKRPLRRILSTNCLPFRELATVLTDIEAMVNRRPLTPVSADLSEVKALCPADLLYGYRTNDPLPPTAANPLNSAEASATVFSKRWRFQQSVLDAFWKRFKKEYLEYLRSAHIRHPSASRPLQPGDLCIMHDTAPSRAFWPLAKVVSTTGGERSDLRKRSCVVRTPSGQTLVRPIHLLYKLEI